jgi:hypothetical protein
MKLPKQAQSVVRNEKTATVIEKDNNTIHPSGGSISGSATCNEDGSKCSYTVTGTWNFK